MITENQENGVFFKHVRDFAISQTYFSSVELGQESHCFDNKFGQEFDNSRPAVKLEFGGLFEAMKHEYGEDGLLIFGKSKTSRSQSVVHFSIWFFQLTAWIVKQPDC